MKHLLAIIFCISISFITVNAQTATADNILKEAYIKAAKDNKKVFLIFHASWCVWCRKMDTSMSDPSCKAFFEKNFVTTHMVVHESKGKEQLENAGALEILKTYKADSIGIPFWVIFDSKGNFLADAKMPDGSNSGCPASEKEVEYFINVLKKISSPGEAEVDAIRTRFRKNE